MMNDCFPDWNFDGDILISSNLRKSFGPDNALIELLWKNGQVVLHSQTHTRPVDQSQLRCDDDVSSYGNTSTLIQDDDDTDSWIQYPLEDDAFRKDLCSSGLLSQLSSSHSHLTKPIGHLEEHGELLSDVTANPMQQPHQSKHTEDLSHCGRNQIPNEPDIRRASKEHAQPSKYDVQNSDSHNYEEKDGIFTSSSGGSGDTLGKTVNLSPKVRGHKRKAKDAEESQCQSKVAELQSPVKNKPKSACRNRAAEVHSLSERKRRDRINEKMRALQELIPHCNKTDKASMLDEAIEYLKSLQLQLQVMWMASGMKPMVFPGVQHYMSAQNQAAMCQTPLNPVNYQNQMQNTAFRNQYARFMASRPMNMMGFNSQQMQQNQKMGAHNIGTANGDFAYRNSKTGELRIRGSSQIKCSNLFRKKMRISPTVLSTKRILLLS